MKTEKFDKRIAMILNPKDQKLENDYIDIKKDVWLFWSLLIVVLFGVVYYCNLSVFCLVIASIGLLLIIVRLYRKVDSNYGFSCSDMETIEKWRDIKYLLLTDAYSGKLSAYHQFLYEINRMRHGSLMWEDSEHLVLLRTCFDEKLKNYIDRDEHDRYIKLAESKKKPSTLALVGSE